MELEVKNRDLLPLPRWNKGKIVLQLPMGFVNEVFYNYFEQLKDKVQTCR